VEHLEDGEVADLVARQVDVRRAEDEGLVALVAASVDERRGLRVGAGHDDPRHTHDVELEAGGVQALDLLVLGTRTLPPGGRTS